MRVLVCGSRSFSAKDVIRDRIHQLPTGTIVMHGNARGADLIADRYVRRYAMELGLRLEIFAPDYASFGRAAPHVRNDAMLDSKPDLVLAFWDGKSPGTGSIIEKAFDRLIPVEARDASGCFIKVDFRLADALVDMSGVGITEQEIVDLIADES